MVSNFYDLFQYSNGAPLLFVESSYDNRVDNRHVCNKMDLIAKSAPEPLGAKEATVRFLPSFLRFAHPADRRVRTSSDYSVINGLG